MILRTTTSSYHVLVYLEQHGPVRERNGRCAQHISGELNLPIERVRDVLSSLTRRKLITTKTKSGGGGTFCVTISHLGRRGLREARHKQEARAVTAAKKTPQKMSKAECAKAGHQRRKDGEVLILEKANQLLRARCSELEAELYASPSDIKTARRIIAEFKAQLARRGGELKELDQRHQLLLDEYSLRLEELETLREQTKALRAKVLRQRETIEAQRDRLTTLRLQQDQPHDRHLQAVA